jgi:hypothetical protein
MKRNYWFTILVILLLTVGVAILVHHFLVCGRLFDVGDFMHHEVFLVIILAFTGGLMVYSYSLKRRK